MSYEINKANGYVKVFRSIWDNPVVSKDADHIAIWLYLLTHATYCGTTVMFAGQRIYLNPGELTTGRKVLSHRLSVSESKVQRVLNAFKRAQIIDQRTDHQCRLITIINWDEYQDSPLKVNNEKTVSGLKVPKNRTTSEQRNEQRANGYDVDMATDTDDDITQSEQRFVTKVNNERTTSEQRVNTNQKRKKERKKEERGPSPVSLSEISSYVREHKLNVKPDVFYAYYEENGWQKKNGQPVSDWRKTLLTWHAREKKQIKYEPEYSPPVETPLPEVKDPVPMPSEIRQKMGDWIRKMDV